MPSRRWRWVGYYSGVAITLTLLSGIWAYRTSSTTPVTEDLAYGVHDLELDVSGYCRTSPPPRWDDLPASYKWDDLTDLTWDDAACLGPPTQTGRWADVPASLRWDQVPASVTWDTYSTKGL